MSVLDKFLDCVSFDTKSDETSSTIPSTPGQKVLGAHLVEVLKEIGVEDAFMSEYGYVYGTIPANVKKAKTVGFVAHMDTATEISGKDVKPRIIESYGGGDIVLNEELGIVTEVSAFPNLKNYIGKKLVVTDGTTLLGGDDKAGIAIILEAAEEIIKGNLLTAMSKSASLPMRKSAEAPINLMSRASVQTLLTPLTAAHLAELNTRTSMPHRHLSSSREEAFTRAHPRTR